MKNYRIVVVKYGWAEIEAENEDEALDIVGDMQDKDFDWSEFGEAEVVEEVDAE